MRMRRMTALALGWAATLMIPVAPALAASPAAADKWHFKVPIGTWAFGVKGTTGVKGISRDVDLSASDVKDYLDKAFGINFEFGKGRWTYLFAASHLEFLEEDLTGPAPSAASADVTMDWDTVEGGASYRAFVANPGPRAFAFNVLGGVRFTQLTGRIEATSGAFDAERDISWTDPFVGAQMAQSLTKHFGWGFRGDIGGFGLSDNNQSQLTWNAAGSAVWHWTYQSGWTFALAAGYKAGGIDYEASDSAQFKMDVTMQGPTIGAVFSW